MSASVRMPAEKGIAFAVREGCRELASEVERVSERTRFRSSSRSIGARSRALRSIAPDAALGGSSSDEDEVSLARRERLSDFPEVSLQLLDPYGGFFREGNIIILEARSILCGVRYPDSGYPPGRVLILSDNLALALALCISLLSVTRRIFASVFRAGFVLSFRWIPLDSDKGKSFL